jgi:hypothetical protein
MKIAQKRHENPVSYKLGIDATMKASIHSSVRFFTNGGKSNPIEQGNEKQSGWIVCMETCDNPPKENTILSPKTNPLWSLSNSKVPSCR